MGFNFTIVFSIIVLAPLNCLYQFIGAFFILYIHSVQNRQTVKRRKKQYII